PVLIHVVDMTQPQGHSTSGSHERYKSKERLAWEAEHDCLLRWRNYILDEGLATEEELAEVDESCKQEVREAREAAWNSCSNAITSELHASGSLINEASFISSQGALLVQVSEDLS